MRILRNLVILFLLAGCAPQKYYLTSDPEMINSYQTLKSNNGYLLAQSEQNRIQNKVILIPQEFSTEQVINNTIVLIQTKKYSKLEKYLDNVDNRDLYIPLSMGLLQIFERNYYGALFSLKTNKLQNVQFIVDLLTVDCEYEISLVNTGDVNYNQFLGKYQKIIDTYNLDPVYKEIINQRIRFIRYKI
jgi:hypothetical protein